MRQLTQGINLEDVQDMNRALVIRILRKLRLCSRADLSKATGLTQPTITNIIGDFIKWHLVTEKGIIEGEKGRRSIGISLNTELYKVIGVRLARKYFSVGMFDLFGSGEILTQEAIDVEEGSVAALQRIRAAVKNLIASSSQFRILGVGVAIPGPFFRTEGRIAIMTEFPGWEKVDLEEELGASFGVPVFLEHDANAGALAEWWLGPHSRETGTMVYVAAGQGVGAGIMIDGRMFRGTLGTAGEIGHMSISYDGPPCECGSRGCLEHYCSTIALMRETQRNLDRFPSSALGKGHSFPAIVKALQDGDELAREQVEKAAWFLGFGLVNVVNTFNPDVIIIGDDLAQTGQPLLDVVVRTVKQHVLPSVFANLRIELSSFEIDPVLVGVSTLVVEKLLATPSAIQQIGVTFQAARGN
ncbi:MAG TPA: ROK family protein [Spirochaetia bacterium]|nr:ROK family protein [Spirochaetia bacterium]